MRLSNITIAATTVFSALMAGLFYSFSCSVMPGLSMLPDGQFIQSMQAINKAIQNPAFFLVFFGILVLLPANAWLQYAHSTTTSFRLSLAACVFYLAGVFCVTLFGNVPMNDTLDKFQTSGASAEALRLCRLSFEGPWNSLNTIRTISSALSLILVVTSCIKGTRLVKSSDGATFSRPTNKAS